MTAGLLWLGTMMVRFYVDRFRAGIRHRFLCFTLFRHALDMVWVAILSLVSLAGMPPPEFLP